MVSVDHQTVTQSKLNNFVPEAVKREGTKREMEGGGINNNNDD